MKLRLFVLLLALGGLVLGCARTSDKVSREEIEKKITEATEETENR